MWPADMSKTGDANVFRVVEGRVQMLKRIHFVLLSIGLCAAIAQAQVLPCPGYDPKSNVTLACEIPTATRTSGTASSLGSLSPTLAAQLSQLPMATAVTGTGLTFSKSLGVFTASDESLGTVLTQRGETIGRHKFLVSFTYQRFAFHAVDGVDLKNLPTINSAVFGTTGTSYTQAQNAINLRVDQFTAIGSYGLTKQVDVSVIVPFSKVTLKTASAIHQYNVSSSGTLLSDFDLGTNFLPGSASGVGDITVNLKANVFNGERTKLALAGDVRFPTGDAANYLGTGAYGIKPYLVFSRTGRVTPNASVGFQWNGASVLFADPKTGVHQNLPTAFLYSGGVDIRVVKKLTWTGEFLGQCVINGPRLKMGTVNIPGQGDLKSVQAVTASYSMNNAGTGIKWKPFKGLTVSANVMFSLDDAGLRSRVVPLVGAAYRF